GDADAGIGDRELHAGLTITAAPWGKRYPHAHAAVPGELDRVGQQVAQNLPQPLPVGEYLGGDVRVDADPEVETLLRGQRQEDRLELLGQPSQREALEIHVHLAGLDLRQVEYVIDQLEQVRAR